MDNDRLRKLIFSLYKKKGKLIFITATALCRLSKKYGKDFVALPIAVGDFGITNLYQTMRKATVTILLGSLGPLYVSGALVVAFVVATLGLRLAFTNPDKILTSFIDKKIAAQNIMPRIADMPDVVSVNLRDKIRMPIPEAKNGECWLAEQALLNPRCQVKATEIPSLINEISHDLSYDDVVNVQDISGLDHLDFSDILDLGKTPISTPKPRVGKTVNFLDLFGDPKDIAEAETWDTSEITTTISKNLRGKN